MTTPTNWGALALRWVGTTLRNDEALSELVPGGVHWSYASDAVDTYIVFDTVGPFLGTEPTIDGRVLDGQGLIRVRIIGAKPLSDRRSSDPEALLPANTRVMELLHHVADQPIRGGGRVLWSRYTDDHGPLRGQDADFAYVELGATFRMLIAPS